jgi:hypothetical protein
MNSEAEVRYELVEPYLDLYADAQGTEKREDVHGVMLHEHRPGEPPLQQVYPTTRSDLVEGDVTDEWSTTLWPQSWFRDPLSGEMTSAFGGSTREFVGRNVAAN